MRAPLLSVAALLVGAALAGVARGQDDAAWKDAYATVGGVPILRSAVEADAQRGVPLPQALQRQISLEVLRQGLAREGVDPGALSAETLSAAVAEAAATLEAMGRKLDDVLKQAGQTQAEFEEALRVPTAFRDLIRREISDEELRAAYAAESLRLTGQVRALHLLVGIRPDRDEGAARARAQELAARLGEAPSRDAFVALVREASDDPMAALTDGDLDWFGAQGSPAVAPGLAWAAFERGNPGLVSGPVRTARGFHLVFVTGIRTPAPVPFEELAPRLRDLLEQRKANERVRAWTEATPIEYAPDAPRLSGAGR